MYSHRRNRLAPLAAGLAVVLAIQVPGVAWGQTRPRPARPSRPAAQTSATPAKGELQLSTEQKTKGRYHMDFDKVEIVEVIKYISQWTNKNFILPDNIRGKITIIGPRDVTADEAYAAFLAALETNNLTVTPTGKFLKIVPKKDSIRTNIPTYLDGSKIPLDERMVTKMIRLKYSEADPIKNVLQQFITREGELVPSPPDVLIISDNALNVGRLERLLEQLDQPGSQDEINVMQVEHANSQEVANVLMQIFQVQQGGTPTPARRPRAAATQAQRDGGAAVADGGGSVSKIIPDERTNKLIVIASGRAFQRIRDLVRKLDVPTDTGQVHVYYLQNADAEQLASTLQGLTGNGAGGGSGAPGGPVRARPASAPAPSPAGGGVALFSSDVKVTADKATNSLLIVASPSDFRNVVRVIERLDIRRRQVFIEAVIMEVKLNTENRLNIDVHTGMAPDVNIGGVSGTAPAIVGSQVSRPGASLNLAGLASLSGFLAGIQGPPVQVGNLGIQLPSFGVILNALQKTSDVNVISTPHVLTSDNEEAEITVGSNVPFQAAFAPGLGGMGGMGMPGMGMGGIGAGLGGMGMGGMMGAGMFGLGGMFAPIQRQPVELRLRLKPQINESDFVRLEIDEQIEEISSVDPQLGPTTAKRSVKTTVVAQDQTTVVIGGLIQDRITRSETKTPILGSIPVVGTLFRGTNVIKERTNLLLFLTPYIIRDQSDFRRIFERKMQERQEFVARFFGASEEYQLHVDYERKSGPLATLRKRVDHEFSKIEHGGPGTAEQRIFTPDGQPAEPEDLPGEDGPVLVPRGSSVIEDAGGFEDEAIQTFEAVPIDAMPGGGEFVDDGGIAPDVEYE